MTKLILLIQTQCHDHFIAQTRENIMAVLLIIISLLGYIEMLNLNINMPPLGHIKKIVG